MKCATFALTRKGRTRILPRSLIIDLLTGATSLDNVLTQGTSLTNSVQRLVKTGESGI